MKRKSGGDFAAFVLDQLGDLGGVTSRAMFGGLALYRDGRIFGMEYRGRVFLRVAPEQRARYEERGMKPFQPMPGRPMTRYYEVPTDVLEDRVELTRWARDAIAAAAAAPAKSGMKAAKKQVKAKESLKPASAKRARRKAAK